MFKHLWKVTIVALGFILLSTNVSLAESKAGKTQVIKITCGTNGKSYRLCKAAAKEFMNATGHKVEVVSNPTDSNGLAYLLQIFSAKSSDIDVCMIDVVWPGILADHLIDLSEHVSKAEQAEFFPSILQNNIIHDRLVAMPWYTDCGLLYYRKDLLEKHGREVPQTWEDLTETAKFVQTKEAEAGNKKMWGFVFQGKALECLTCNAFEWVAAYNGGTLIESNGKVSVNNPQAQAALTLASSWVGTISPKGVLNYGEEDSRGVFQSGNAVFMRNWPYAWPLANFNSPVAGKIGIAPLPKGGADGQSAAALGGWQLAVSRYSKNKELAVKFVKYLTSYEIQKKRALEANYLPTRPKVFNDAEIKSKLPHFGLILTVLKSALARPAKHLGTGYNPFSHEFSKTSHRILAGRGEPKKLLVELNQKLESIKSKYRRGPAKS